MNFQIFDPHRLTLAAPWTSAVSRTLKCMKKSVVRELPTAIKSWPDIGINRSQVLNKVICWENRFRAPKARGYTSSGNWTRLSVLIVVFCRLLRLCRRALHMLYPTSVFSGKFKIHYAATDFFVLKYHTWVAGDFPRSDLDNSSSAPRNLPSKTNPFGDFWPESEGKWSL